MTSAVGEPCLDRLSFTAAFEARIVLDLDLPGSRRHAAQQDAAKIVSAFVRESPQHAPVDSHLQPVPVLLPLLVLAHGSHPLATAHSLPSAAYGILKLLPGAGVLLFPGALRVRLHVAPLGLAI